MSASSVRPAAFLSLAPRGLFVGAEAHIAVYDPKGTTRIDEDRLHQHCGWSPYHGMDAIFPQLVVSPGGVLVHDGVFQQSKANGRYVGLTLEDYVARDRAGNAVSPSS